MSSETQIGKLVIDLKIKTEALEKGLETAKQKLEKIEEENKKVQSTNSGLETSYVALSVTAVASLVKITSALDDGVAEYTKYKNSMMTVNKVAQNTGNTLEDIQKIINESNEFKLMSETDLNASIKNLLLYGYTAEQATEILKRLQDSAVGNRQECYSLSEAVRVTTEGIRMENSVTSDAAGVQKNIAKMYEEHAEKIGKTTDSLTQAEKAQAVYNGIMEETAPIIGSAAQVASQYEGQQAQANAETLKFKQLLGESLVPTYTELSKVQRKFLSELNEIIKSNKPAVAGIATLGVSLLGIIGATGAAVIGITAYRKAAEAANMTTKAFTTSILANPLFIGAITLSVGIAALNMFNAKMQESIDKFAKEKEESEQIVEILQNFQNNDMSFTETEVTQLNNIVENTKSMVSSLEQRKTEIKNEQDEIQKELNRSYIDGDDNNISLLNERLKKLGVEFNDAEKDIEKYNNRINNLNYFLGINKQKQEYLNATNVKAHRETLINIAQTKADIQGKQQLLNILKEGKTTTDEYADAKNQLVKIYPELAKVNENTIASTQSAIDAENAAADAEWANAQIAIQSSILEAQAMLSNSEKIKIIAAATKQSVDQVTASLQNQINVLSNLANLSPADFKGSVTTNFVPRSVRSSGSKTYSNKALDNYKKEIEYKKSMDRLCIEEEIKMYRYALTHYAKTLDERRELDVKIYELEKELRDKNLDDYNSYVEYLVSMDKATAQQQVWHYSWALENLAKTTEQKRDLEIKLHELHKELAQEEREMLQQQTNEYEKYIENQKNLRGAEYDIKDQQADYDKIILMHKTYLDKIMKDERLSLSERKEIYQEELDTIRNYELQKRELRVSAINNTVSQLKDAITKELEEMQEADEKAINKNLEAVEKWKDERINAINEEYDARIKAIQDELDALDEAEKQKSRDEEDAEYNKKKLRLEQLIAFEHDATTKANYQKELDKLIADYQKTLDKRALQDKKDALKEQQDILKEEQGNKVQAVEDEAKKQQEIYEEQLDKLQEYYDKQKEIAQETAEKMLLNVEQNQEQILNLLNKYGDKYEITGQSLGEKLAQGINEGLARKIENVIQRIQDTIDAGIENKIRGWTSGMYKYEAGANKPQTKTISITQQNYIEQNPEMPSETYRKLRNIDEELAASLAGM